MRCRTSFEALHAVSEAAQALPYNPETRQGQFLTGTEPKRTDIRPKRTDTEPKRTDTEPKRTDTEPKEQTRALYRIVAHVLGISWGPSTASQALGKPHKAPEEAPKRVGLNWAGNAILPSVRSPAAPMGHGAHAQGTAVARDNAHCTPRTWAKEGKCQCVSGVSKLE